MYLYGVILSDVTLSEGHMIANHPIYGGLAIMWPSQKVTW